MNPETFNKLAGDFLEGQTPVHAKVLDIGCSSGGAFSEYFWRVLKKKDIEYHGIDPDRWMLALLRRSRRDYRKVHLYCCTIDEFSHPLSSFDQVVLTYTYHHLPDVGSLFTKIRDLLRPEGSLLIVDDCLPGETAAISGEEPTEMKSLRKLLPPDRINRYLGYVHDSGFKMVYRNPNIQEMEASLKGIGFNIENSTQQPLDNGKTGFWIHARKAP